MSFGAPFSQRFNCHRLLSAVYYRILVLSRQIGAIRMLHPVYQLRILQHVFFCWIFNLCTFFLLRKILRLHCLGSEDNVY